MDASAILEVAESYVKAIALAPLRILGFTMLLPFFNAQVLAAPIKSAVVFALSVIMLPVLAESLQAETLPFHLFLIISVKEFVLGVLLGFPVALIFLIPQSVGDFIDNQRGAGIAALFNPSFGGQSNLLGILLGETFLAAFLALGGMMVLLTILYDSYVLYPILEPAPQFTEESLAAFVRDFAEFMAEIVKLSMPIVFAMMMAEIGLGLVGRFAPQLQVFFLAMSIKGMLAIFVLLFYTSLIINSVWQDFSMKSYLPLLSN